MNVSSHRGRKKVADNVPIRKNEDDGQVMGEWDVERDPRINVNRDMNEWLIRESLLKAKIKFSNNDEYSIFLCRLWDWFKTSKMSSKLAILPELNDLLCVLSTNCDKLSKKQSDFVLAFIKHLTDRGMTGYGSQRQQPVINTLTTCWYKTELNPSNGFQEALMEKIKTLSDRKLLIEISKRLLAEAPSQFADLLKESLNKLFASLSSPDDDSGDDERLLLILLVKSYPDIFLLIDSNLRHLIFDQYPVLVQYIVSPLSSLYRPINVYLCCVIGLSSNRIVGHGKDHTRSSKTFNHYKIKPDP